LERGSRNFLKTHNQRFYKTKTLRKEGKKTMLAEYFRALTRSANVLGVGILLMMMLMMMSSSGGLVGAVHRLECPDDAGAAITLDKSLAYVTSGDDLRLNAILCETSGTYAKRVCLPVSCELSAGSICAIQSPNGADFDPMQSLCVQTASAIDYSKWLNRQRKAHYESTELDGKQLMSAASGVEDPTWVEHCMCTIRTRNWFLNSRSSAEGAANNETMGSQGEMVDAKREDSSDAIDAPSPLPNRKGRRPRRESIVEEEHDLY
jgi:hypothetical protein